MDKFLVVIGSIAGIMLLAMLLAWPIQFLWNNCLVGAVNGVNEIGFWQALGINILTSVLFKNSNANTSK